MSIEAKTEQNDNLLQEYEAIVKERMELADEIITAWKVTYLKDKSDQKYEVYAYKLLQWGNRWWIKNKYINQIWAWVEWTKFTDEWWREISKDRFNEWEIVYLRVPKQDKQSNSRETNNNAGTVEFVKNYKDTENKDWKIYKYTFIQWGNLEWVKDKYDKQIGVKDWHIMLHYINVPIYLCNTNWDKLSKSHFDKGETIYFKVPNVDIVNTTPEMNINDIMNLSDNDITWIYDDYASLTKSPNRHIDKNWTFIIVNNKKIYEQWGGKNYISNRTYISIEAHETITNIYNISIRRKEWNNISWIFYEWDGWDYDSPYRWKLEISEEGLAYPKWYWDRWK